MKIPSPRKLIIILAVLALIAATGTFLAKNGSGSRKKMADQVPSPATEEKRPVNVVIQTVAPKTVEESFTLPGTLEAWEDLTLSLEQPGTIQWVGPREGDHLSAGEPILKIDKELLISQRNRNQADFDLKTKQLKRVEALFREKLVSERVHDEAKQAWESARALLDQSRIAIEKSTLVSPIDGILDRLLVDRGEYGNVGTPAAVVLQVDRLKVLVDIPEKDVTAVRVGQKVQVMSAGVNGGEGIIRSGQVISVSYQADEKTRTYLTKVEIDNSTGMLRPGMIVRARFVRRIIEGAIAVPLYAVIDRKGEKSLFVVENGMAVERKVRLGPVVGGKVVIFGGVQADEQLVVKGQQLLYDGSPVTVVDAGEGQE